MSKLFLFQNVDLFCLMFIPCFVSMGIHWISNQWPLELMKYELICWFVTKGFQMSQVIWLQIRGTMRKTLTFFCCKKCLTWSDWLTYQLFVSTVPFHSLGTVPPPSPPPHPTHTPVFKNTALTSNLTAFPKINTTVSMTFSNISRHPRNCNIAFWWPF